VTYRIGGLAAQWRLLLLLLLVLLLPASRYALFD
jgi:hypothetical protein